VSFGFFVLWQRQKLALVSGHKTKKYKRRQAVGFSSQDSPFLDHGNNSSSSTVTAPKARFRKQAENKKTQALPSTWISLQDFPQWDQ